MNTERFSERYSDIGTQPSHREGLGHLLNSDAVITANHRTDDDNDDDGCRTIKNVT